MSSGNQPGGYATPPAAPPAPTGYGTPGGYPAAGGYPPPGGYPAPGGYPTPGSGGGGGGGKGVLWALGGAVAASAVWAGVLVATGGFGSDSPKAELGNYHYLSNVCSSLDLQTYEDGGYQKDDSDSGDNPQHSSAKHPALDSMACNVDYKPSGSTSDDYASAGLYTTVSLHKKTDPQPEFAASYKVYAAEKTDDYHYTITKVPDLGDEAYLVTQVDSSSEGGEDKNVYQILGVRDGWMTYQATWSEYSGESGSTASNSDVTRMLEKSARNSLRTMAQ